jgi:hypothetical protein
MDLYLFLIVKDNTKLKLLNINLTVDCISDFTEISPGQQISNLDKNEID